MQKRLKNSKEIAEFRNKLLQKQSGLDPIINTPIKKPCLDHDHKLPCKVRAVLESEVNCYLGKLENGYNRYLKHLTNKPLHEILANVIVYLKQDYQNNPLHSTAIKTELRTFRRLKANKQKQVLEKLKLVPKESASGRIKQIRKLLLSEELNHETLKNLCEGSE